MTAGRTYIFKGRRDEPMPTNRRTVLTLLGLAGAGAVGTESFVTPPAAAGDMQSVSDAYSTERFAKAFEQIAAAIRAGQIEVHSLGIVSDMRPNDIADVHDLNFKFRHLPEV